MRKGTCKHFCGFNQDTCEAGVNYLELAGGKLDGMALRLPCNGHFAARAQEKGIERVRCPKREEPTKEEIEADRKQMDAIFERMERTIPWASAIKAKCEKGKGGSGIDACPICGKEIHWSVSSFNHHMHAKCSTEDCINFME